MILVLTALGGDTLCEPHLNRNAGCQPALSNGSNITTNVVTMPFHWNNFNKFQSDYNKIQHVYLRILPKIVNCLNVFHNKKWSLRQWEIVIGPWLRTFISIVFERHQSLKIALAEYPISRAAYASKDCRKSPVDTLDFFDLARQDAWNQALMLDIIRLGFQSKIYYHYSD